MTAEKTPSFLRGAFLWDKQGYSFPSPPGLQLTDPSCLTHENKWIVLASILAFAKDGVFSYIDWLPDLTDAAVTGGLAQSTLYLFGDAGGSDALPRLNKFMEDESASYVRVKACQAASCAGYPWLARSILNVWRDLPQERGVISLYLSSMLEPQDSACGKIADYLGFEENEDYIAYVNKAIDAAEQRYGPQQPLYQGVPMSMNVLLTSILKVLEQIKNNRNAEALMADLRHRFEAQTGINCSRFFAAGRLCDEVVARTVEEFSRERASAFAAGRRYFFGHEIL